MTRPPAILIGLDAVEISRVDRLLSEGRLPNLRRLRERGCQGRIETRPPAFLSMVWPTFFNGTGIGRHGWCYNKMWRPEHMRIEYASPEWLPQRPFWDELDPSRYRQCLVDVPFTPAPPKDLNGIFLTGWQNHDDFGRRAVPAGLIGELRRRFGRPRLEPENFGPQTPASLQRLRREIIETNAQFAGVSADLLGRGPWDLFVTVLGGAHRGAHYLWDLGQVDVDDDALAGACDDLYASTDEALGTILDAAPDGARILVFALHGMGRNPGWADHFAAMTGRILSGGAEPPAKKGLVYGIKNRLPWSLVRQVTRRLPTSINHALVPLWSQRMFDWEKTRFFPLPVDVNGYVRINLEGREPRGIVKPGAAYDDLCAELEEAFLSFRTIETNEPVVAAVARASDLVPGDAERLHLLPDLVVEWAPGVFASDCSGVRSDLYGELRWPRGAKLPSGRSGNHVASGWFVGSGPGIEPGAAVDLHDTVDLAPTVLTWLDAGVPERFEGRPIPELAQPASSD